MHHQHLICKSKSNTPSHVLIQNRICLPDHSIINLNEIRNAKIDNRLHTTPPMRQPYPQFAEKRESKKIFQRCTIEDVTTKGTTIKKQKVRPSNCASCGVFGQRKKRYFEERKLHLSILKSNCIHSLSSWCKEGVGRKCGTFFLDSIMSKRCNELDLFSLCTVLQYLLGTNLMKLQLSCKKRTNREKYRIHQIM